MNLKKETSRLKKKLTLYFLLISIVSISVSAEIILEFSSGRFSIGIRSEMAKSVTAKIPEKYHSVVKESLKDSSNFDQITDLRNRMLLLLLVVFGCIVGAFFMFTKDIVSPMDGIVEATKKIAEGDLTVDVPVMSDDEIGQIGKLINEMNVNLQDMIMQIRQEISRHKLKIQQASDKITEFTQYDSLGNIIENKKMKVSDFRKMISLSSDVMKLLEVMMVDLSALETFVKMYKTYAVSTEIEQMEIEKAIDSYNSDISDGGENS